MEAAEECMRQIRLRNLSGMILIDFINMEHAQEYADLEIEIRRLCQLDPVMVQFIDFTGLGNSLYSRSVNKSIAINEAVVNALETHKFFTNGKDVFAVKNVAKKINEGEEKAEKPVVNEQVNKMKHLLDYKPKNFVDTKNVKKNRGF